MKKNKRVSFSLSKTFAIFCAVSVFLLCSCSENEENIDEETTENKEFSEIFPEENDDVSNMYKISDGDENYLLTLIKDTENSGKVSVSIDSNDFNSENVIVTSPDGYVFSENFFKVYSEENTPDMLEFTFTNDKGESVCRYYMIKSGKLTEISIENDGEILPYIKSSSFYRSEHCKYISSIIIDESKSYQYDISEKVKIRTYTFDFENASLSGKFEDIDRDNMLYFGYAYWGLANSIVLYFTDSTLNVSDYENYREEENEDKTESFYFKVDDERFPDTDSLKSELRNIFSEELSEEIFDNAPQDYRDFDDGLYTLMGETLHDDTLGMMTFSSYEENEDKTIITYHTIQEKYNDDGDFVYIDGGDFVIEDTGEYYSDETGDYSPHRFIITKYRYPYSSQ